MVAWCLKACAADANAIAEVGVSRSDRKSCNCDQLLHIHLYICIYIHTYIFTNYINLSIHTYIYIHMNIYVNIYTHTYICMRFSGRVVLEGVRRRRERHCRGDREPLG